MICKVQYLSQNKYVKIGKACSEMFITEGRFFPQKLNGYKYVNYILINVLLFIFL